MFADDLDGTVLESSVDLTVQFGIDGKQYEIELLPSNTAALCEALAALVARARKAKSGAAAAGATNKATNPARAELLAAARTWALEDGYTMSVHGRVAKPIVDAGGVKSSKQQPAG